MFADAYIKNLGYLWCHLNFRTLQEPNFVCLSLKSTASPICIRFGACEVRHLKQSTTGHYWANFSSQRGTRHSVVHQWETYEAENNFNRV